MRCWINDECITANKGEFYFVQPGQTHQEETIEGPVDIYYLKFYYLDLKGQINYYIPPPGNPKEQILRDPDKQFLSLFKQVYIEHSTKITGSKQLMESIVLYMTLLLKKQLKLDEPISPCRTNLRAELVNKSINYIKENYKGKFSLDDKL